jgi:hypothetical protein
MRRFIAIIPANFKDFLRKFGIVGDGQIYSAADMNGSDINSTALVNPLACC